MKDAIHLPRPGGQSHPAMRVSEARLRVGATEGADEPRRAALPAPEMAMDLLSHLSNEIADVLMTLRPSLLALDELAHNEPLLVEHANCAFLASGRLNQYVEDINLLVGSAAGAEPIQPLPIIEEFIDRIVVEPSNARFTSRLALDLCEVALRPDELRTLCRNLIENALTATQRGGEVRIDSDNVRLLDSTRTGLPMGDYLRLRVTDDGVGMTESVLARAKNPFFTTWGRFAHWRGLGLTQVDAICRRARGALHLQSLPGRGTVATALLRRAEHHRATHEAGRSESIHREVLPAHQFLLVDDDAQILAVLARELTGRGHRVQLAQDPHTALAILNEEFPCGTVVIDLVLGQQSGVALARDIAELRPDLRLVLTTALCTEHDSGLPSQVSYLLKPFDADDLLSLLGGQSDPYSGR